MPEQIAKKGKPLALLPLGDSITAAPWFRRALKAGLDRGGIATDFVGTQYGANPEGGFLDGEHEGHPGYTIEGIRDLLRGPARDAVLGFRPDIVTVLLGTNDIGQGKGAGAEARLRSLIELLLRDHPGARIVVGTIPPIVPPAFGGYERYAADVPVFNRQVTRLVTAFAATRRVSLADIYAALPPTKEYIGDGVHPTGYGVADKNDGYKRVGDAFCRAVVAAVKRPAP